MYAGQFLMGAGFRVGSVLGHMMNVMQMGNVFATVVVDLANAGLRLIALHSIAEHVIMVNNAIQQPVCAPPTSFHQPK